MICEQQPKGDYFHNFIIDKDLCRKCMHVEDGATRQCSLCIIERYHKRLYLRQFVPARYCSFFHDHDGTNAAVELISRKELRQKTRVENYLYRFEAKME